MNLVAVFRFIMVLAIFHHQEVMALKDVDDDKRSLLKGNNNNNVDVDADVDVVDEKPPLPAGWSEHFDPDSGRYYYYNSDGTTTWDRPPPDELQENSVVDDGETSKQPSQDPSRLDNESGDRDVDVVVKKQQQQTTPHLMMMMTQLLLSSSSNGTNLQQKPKTECSVDKDHHSDIVEGGVVHCDGTRGLCEGAKINGCDELLCSGDDCKQINVQSTNTVRCTGKKSCLSAKINGCDELICSAEHACNNVNVQSTNIVTCTNNSCWGAKINSADKVLCEGCWLASFEDVTYVKCQVVFACNIAAFNKVDLINCNSQFACDQVGLIEEDNVAINGTIFCGAADSCGPTLMTQVQNSEGCLICNQDSSCIETIDNQGNHIYLSRGMYGDRCSMETIIDLCNIDPNIAIDFLSSLEFGTGTGDGVPDCGQLPDNSSDESI